MKRPPINLWPPKHFWRTIIYFKHFVKTLKIILISQLNSTHRLVYGVFWVIFLQCLKLNSDRHSSRAYSGNPEILNSWPLDSGQLNNLQVTKTKMTNVERTFCAFTDISVSTSEEHRKVKLSQFDNEFSLIRHLGLNIIIISKIYVTLILASPFPHTNHLFYQLKVPIS